MKNMIYLDHNATTPVDPEVLEEMLPYFSEIYGNAASVDHEVGNIAKQAVETAREICRKTINAKSEKEIIFTSGATESDNIAIFGVAEQYADKGNHIITCVTEHKAVLDCCTHLEARGKRVTYLPVDEYGLIDLEKLEQAITPETVLITIMFANNEIGTIQPIKEIGAIARKYGVIFHTDAAQAVGHVPIDVQDMNIDILSFSAHKIYGPKGIGGLYVRRRSFPPVKLSPVIHGGGHEFGLRSGTLNVPAIVGLGKALDIANKKMEVEAERYHALTTHMLAEFKSRLGDENVMLNGHPTARLTHNLNISLRGIESRSLIVQLKNIAISTGSACTSTEVKPSHVIEALGFGEERAHSAIRIGLGRGNTDEQIEQAIDTIVAKVNHLQKFKV
ncbi:MAG: cysteine desulfurase [Chloroflexi bacterium]|nr:MAG: cysteine desulfurase [Chloroflexota bacterium]